MRYWRSSSTDFLKTVPADDLNQQFISKILDIDCDKKQDNLMIQISNHKRIINGKIKREILAIIASVYDRLEYLSLAVTKMKVFLQRLWEGDKD